MCRDAHYHVGYGVYFYFHSCVKFSTHSTPTVVLHLSACLYANSQQLHALHNTCTTHHTSQPATHNTSNSYLYYLFTPLYYFIHYSFLFTPLPHLFTFHCTVSLQQPQKSDFHKIRSPKNLASEKSGFRKISSLQKNSVQEKKNHQICHKK